MGKPAKHLIVYDVSEDQERLRVAKLIEGFGIRVQKSAFECHLSRGQRETLVRRLNDLALASGYVFVYRLDSRAKRLSAGKAPPNPLDDSNYAFVL